MASELAACNPDKAESGDDVYFVIRNAAQQERDLTTHLASLCRGA